ncbi:hypothetical protein FH972_025831 [Carpinus fangiana]|uniref:Amino acid permease/ SLC12A domain-containing protein n=1 Tax=Carpinus fangiana TaxID=176857 RepID=A0A5N6L2Q6_9ROSI|nr:hypothetical protein FH972_025831 [Carpinus fangiana]
MNSGGAFDDDAQFKQYAAEATKQGGLTVDGPTRNQRLGRFTVMCLILNRTIGTGIFVGPTKVLQGTGSVGTSIIFWAVGGLVATCGLLVWLEFGLSVPLTLIPGGGGEKRATCRSGGEKNSMKLEFVFHKPLFLTTCMYGIVFIVLGNLSGNAIAFGSYVMTAAGSLNPSKGAVIGLAIFALSACILLHITSRAGGIAMNNAFAVYKVMLLLTIIILGFIKAGGYDLGGGPNAISNLDPKHSFDTQQYNAASYIDSFLYVLYSYSGYKQPFYVLAEISRPRKTFPITCLITMAIVITLFVLTNISYLCVVSKQQQLETSTDMATLFLIHMFGYGTAQRTMAALIATSIFGNILVMTFTAARVKQEIAKEGILPFPLNFATAKTTVLAPLAAKVRRWLRFAGSEDHLEHSPIAALILHWFSSVFLIAVTSMLPPSQSYAFLVYLWALLYVKIERFSHRDWKNVRNFRVWLDGKHSFPWHALIYFSVCGFLLYAVFVRPSPSSPYSKAATGIDWWVVPTIGQSTWLWGLVWYGGLQLVMKKRREYLVVMRFPLIDRDHGSDDQWIQKSEIVTRQWLAMDPTSDASSIDSASPGVDEGRHVNLHLG